MGRVLEVEQCSHEWIGDICNKCALWHTEDLVVREDPNTDFSVLLVDEEFYKLFREVFQADRKPIEGKRLGTIAHALASLYGALDRWRLCEPSAWQQQEIDQLQYLPMVCSRAGGNTSSANCICDPARINDLANSYVDILQRHPEIRPKFGTGYWTIYTTTVRFGNTLGCGGALQSVIDFYS